MGKIIAVANQKGGVGKTTTAVNVACCMGVLGKKILLCDFDPQGNSSSGVGVRSKEGRGIYDVIMGNCTVAEAIITTKWCDVLPTNTQLAASEIELAQVAERNNHLRDVLATIKNNYDFIIIDCPPSLALLTVNALAACDTVLVPMQCEYYALEGLSQLVTTIRTVKKAINTKIEFEGIVLTMYDGRTNLTIQVAEEIKKFFGNKVYKTVVPRSIRLSEAPSHGLPIIAYDKMSKGGIAYLAIAEEIIKNNR